MYVDCQKEFWERLDYPIDVAEAWCRRTREFNSTGRAPYLLDLINRPTCAGTGGGFTWSQTPEGHTRWRDAIEDHKYVELLTHFYGLGDEQIFIDFKHYD